MTEIFFWLILPNWYIRVLLEILADGWSESWKQRLGEQSFSEMTGRTDSNARGGEILLNPNFQDIKEQVRTATNIVELVSGYVHLIPRGRFYVGLCPWHEDSRPSLQVDPQRQTFRCWVCALGGDVFSFLMKMEGVTFSEALRILAERAKIELPKEPARKPYSGASSKILQAGPKGIASLDTQSLEGKRGLYQAGAWAVQQYHAAWLALPEEHPVKRYCAARHLSEETYRKFQTGFAPNEWNWLEKEAKGDKLLLQRLLATGFLGWNDEQSRYYDRFRGRLLFPIHDFQGRTVGIGGRVIPEVECNTPTAKYLNTPETPLFSKHRLLYGLDLARKSMDKKHRVLVMEGYTDVMMAHQHGFTESVAVLGTALGLDHIEILRRYNVRIYLVLDGDAAGQKRAAEVLELFVSRKVDVQILTLPEGLDPAEFLEQHGAAALEAALEKEAVDALTHAYNIYTQDVDWGNIHEMDAALEKILRLIAAGIRHSRERMAESSFREEKLLQKLSFRFSVSEDFLRRRLRELQEEVHRAEFLREENFEKNGNLALSPPARKEEKTLQSLPSERMFMKDEEADFQEFSEEVREEDFFGDDPTLWTGETFEKAADIVDWNMFGKMDAWQREFVSLLFYQPELLTAARHAIAAQQLNYVPAREVYLRMCELQDDGLPATFERVMTSFESERVKSWMTELDATSAWTLSQKSPEECEKILQHLIQNYQAFQLQSRKLRDLEAFHSQGLDEEQKIAMFRTLLEEKRRIQKKRDSQK